ncbi:ABC transporter substrate-binding protein [Kribbella turkmenica]|nr:ABC transporter substrate-binding protein [Kribbella turkmenica]
MTRTASIEGQSIGERRLDGAKKSMVRVVAPAIAALLVVGLAACGNSEKPAAAGGSGGAADLGTLKVLQVTPNDVSAVALAATFKLNMWEGTGLKVETVLGQPSTEAAALTRGDMDLSTRGASSQLANMAKGVPAKLMGAVRLPTSMYLVSSTKSGINDPEDLRKGGINFGISSFGSSSDEVVKAVVTHYALSQDQYKVTALGDIKGILAAFKRGDIDAFAWSAGDAFAMEGEGLGKVLGNAEQWQQPSVSVAYAVSDKAIKERPEALKKFFEVYYSAVEKLRADPKIALDIYVNDWKYPQAVGEKAVKDELPTLSTDGQIPAENLKNLGATVSESFEIKDLDATKYWDYWKNLE